jgi:hypothetical protein
MRISVEIDLTIDAEAAHLEAAREVAERLTVSRDSVQVRTAPDEPRWLLVDFEIRKAREIVVLPRISRAFRAASDHAVCGVSCRRSRSR